MIAEYINIYSFFLHFYSCLRMFVDTNEFSTEALGHRQRFTSEKVRKKTWGQIAGKQKVAGGSWECQGESNMLHKTATWICWSPARDPELGHQHRGNSLGKNGPWKHGLGAAITAWLPVLPNTDVRTTQWRGKPPWPCCHLVPLCPHVQNSSFHRSGWASRGILIGRTSLQ